MVLGQWFDRFLGQIVAPDEKYQPQPEDVEERSSFWQTVAPDPNFVPTHQNQEQAGSSKLASTNTPTSTDSGDPSLQGSNRTTALSPLAAQGTGGIPLNACLSTPSPKSSRPASAGGAIMNSSDLETRVLQANSDTYDAKYQGDRKEEEKIMRWCALSTELSEPLQIKLTKAIQRRPDLTNARSVGLGVLCPDGYTPLMAAAKHNHVAAARILLQHAPVEPQLQATNMFGQSAKHIASEEGHLEMLDFLNRYYGDAAPVDLKGRTPLGSALTSPLGKAQRHRGALMERLFSPVDVSVIGTPRPAVERLSSCPALSLSYGVADMPGKRIIMEDALLATVVTNPSSSSSSMGLFAVCDGHGDNGRVSHFVSSKLPEMISKNMQTGVDWTAAFLDLDSKLRASKLQGGTTACVALVSETHITTLNVGDSRCVLIRYQAMKGPEQDTADASAEKATAQGEGQGESTSSSSTEDVLSESMKSLTLAKKYEAVPLTIDHKPDLPDEQKRIQEAGLKVVTEEFVENGKQCSIAKVALTESSRLACARAFGDFEYKANANLAEESQAVVAVPDVRTVDRTGADIFLVVACDGIWDVMSNEEVADFIMNCEEEDLPTVGDKLLAECLRRGSRDNMSVILVSLSPLGNQHPQVAKTLDFGG